VTPRPAAPPSPWSEDAIEAACRRATDWYRQLPRFESRAVVGGGQVVGRRQPALLSERDCVIHFARFLHEEGVPWEDIHNEVTLSRWMFEAPHPAATVMSAHPQRRRVDLALINQADFLAAKLPATSSGFKFDAFVEFGYLSDYFVVPGARNWGEPLKGQRKVKEDVAKIDRHLEVGACRLGYVVVFMECDAYTFPDTFGAEVERAHGCRVRFVRGY
jgi:hypothetical protein